MENGEVDIEEYLKSNKEGLELDKKLLEFYKQRNDQPRLKFIQEKIKIIKKEIDDTEAAMQEGQ